MARHSGIKAMLVLGGLCAAGVMIYKNRDLICGFVDELTGAAARNSDGYDTDAYFDCSPEAGENDIVIDRVAENGEAESEKDEAEPEKDGEAGEAKPEDGKEACAAEPEKQEEAGGAC